MTELKVELDLLESASKRWHEDVSVKLAETAKSVEDLKYSALQFGLFAGAWQAYSAAAAYVQDRLREGSTAAQQISDALHTVATTYGNQDTANAQSLGGLNGSMEYTG